MMFLKVNLWLGGGGEERSTQDLVHLFRKGSKEKSSVGVKDSLAMR